MNKLDRNARSRILHLLCEGSSIRAVTRLTGASKNTVVKLMIDAGKACAEYHDEHVANLKSRRIQVDEIWSFTYAKQKNVAKAKAAPDHAGDTWTWTALDAGSHHILTIPRLVVQYVRNRECDRRSGPPRGPLSRGSSDGPT